MTPYLSNPSRAPNRRAAPTAAHDSHAGSGAGKAFGSARLVMVGHLVDLPPREQLDHWSNALRLPRSDPGAEVATEVGFTAPRTAASCALVVHRLQPRLVQRVAEMDHPPLAARGAALAARRGRGSVEHPGAG